MNGWIETASGKKFYPTEPRIEDIDIEDIAHALSHLCRFTGHCEVFYSVAQHCVLASRYCPEHPMWGLLHDAAEAYLGDVSRPIKQELPMYQLWEERLLCLIAGKFGLPFPPPECVKEIDDRMLATERRDLMAPGESNYWDGLDGVEPFDAPISPWDALTARHQFLKRFSELY